MNFVVSSTALLKQLQAISGVLNTNNTLPILDNFLFDIKESELVISASDLESTITVKVPAESKQTGVVCIQARLLLDTLKTFADQPLTFTIDPTTFGVEIASDYGKYKLNGYNGDEFPKSPELDEAATITLNADMLCRAINKTIFATGSDDLRPVMSGVFFDFNESGITFVATDAHKLVRYTRHDAKADKEASFIVPKKPLNMLKNLLANTTSDVVIAYNESNVHFQFDDCNLVSRLIDGKYPNYQAVIPKDNPNKLNISRTSLQSSIKRVSIFSSKSTHQVRLKIAGSNLSVSAEDIDFANEANEQLTCSYEGQDMEIGFNSRFVNEMLSNIDCEDVMIELSAPSRAGILSPATKDLPEEDVLMLVMPVMLNNN